MARRCPVRSITLLSLPFELRTKIWSYALGGTVFEVRCWPRRDPERIETQIVNREKHRCSLLRTCHQIHNETKLFLFRHNAFVFKNEDAIVPWLQRFGESDRDAISEIRLVTWGAAHMVQGHRSSLKPVSLVLPLEQLPGLTRLQIEIRTKANCRSCWHSCCRCCKSNLELAKAQLEASFAKRQTRLEVEFAEQQFGSIVAAQLL